MDRRIPSLRKHACGDQGILRTSQRGVHDEVALEAAGQPSDAWIVQSLAPQLHNAWTLFRPSVLANRGIHVYAVLTSQGEFWGPYRICTAATGAWGTATVLTTCTRNCARRTVISGTKVSDGNHYGRAHGGLLFQWLSAITQRTTSCPARTARAFQGTWFAHPTLQWDNIFLCTICSLGSSHVWRECSS